MTGPALLLYSFTEFRDLIRACFAMAQPRSILEIGSESGAFTRELMSLASEGEGQLWCVEPHPTLELVELDAEEKRFHLISGRSPEALDSAPACDAYVIDGDHNYWTLLSELEEIDRAAGGGGFPLVLLHDVSWPCARRDQYYAPEALPDEAVHPYSWDLGSVPGKQDAVQGGLRGQGGFAIALREGGPRNGVLTAIEDFVESREQLRFARVPVVFGLGVMWRTDAPYAAPLGAMLDPFDGNPLLERVERNRAELYVRLLELQDSVSKLGLRQGRLIAEYDRSLTAAEVEVAALRQRLATLSEEERVRG